MLIRIKKYSAHERGQALVILLFYMIIAITLTTTAVAVVVSNSLSATRNEQGAHALQIAEAGAENAIVRLLRSTSYSGETLTVGAGVATVTVTGTTTKIIRSIGTISGFSRTVQVTATITNGILEVIAWQEI